MSTTIFRLCNPSVYPSQEVAYSSNTVAVHSQPYPPGALSVYLIPTTFCYVTVGVNAVATASNGLVWFDDRPILIDLRSYNFTQPWRVSVLRVTSAPAGILYITPCNQVNR